MNHLCLLFIRITFFNVRDWSYLTDQISPEQEIIWKELLEGTTVRHKPVPDSVIFRVVVSLGSVAMVAPATDDI